MRARKQIEADESRKDILILEVLLDIRELLKKKVKKSKKEVCDVSLRELGSSHHS